MPETLVRAGKPVSGHPADALSSTSLPHPSRDGEIIALRGLPEGKFPASPASSLKLSTGVTSSTPAAPLSAISSPLATKEIVPPIAPSRRDIKTSVSASTIRALKLYSSRISSFTLAIRSLTTLTVHQGKGYVLLQKLPTPGMDLAPVRSRARYRSRIFFGKSSSKELKELFALGSKMSVEGTEIKIAGGGSILIDHQNCATIKDSSGFEVVLDPLEVGSVHESDDSFVYQPLPDYVKSCAYKASDGNVVVITWPLSAHHNPKLWNVTLINPFTKKARVLKIEKVFRPDDTVIDTLGDGTFSISRRGSAYQASPRSTQMSRLTPLSGTSTKNILREFSLQAGGVLSGVSL